MLEELRRAQVKATFFVLGREVSREPALARQIAAEGHELALHGYDHLRLDQMTADAARANLVAGLRAIEEVTGERPSWFRPPYGRLSPASLEVCHGLGLRVAYWSAWGMDWEDASATAIVSEVRTDLSGGAIVLLHDTARYGRRDSAAATAQAIGAIVRDGRDRGWSWRSLSEATSGGAERPDAAARA